MEINFLLEYINLITMGICLCVGFAIKEAFEFIPNKYIPLVMLVLGTILAVTADGLSLECILSGMVSGLASTGFYELLRNMINKGAEQ